MRGDHMSEGWNITVNRDILTNEIKLGFWREEQLGMPDNKWQYVSSVQIGTESHGISPRDAYQMPLARSLVPQLIRDLRREAGLPDEAASEMEKARQIIATQKEFIVLLLDALTKAVRT